ncbi:MAG: hypothetical protein IIB22_10155 [Chloroflexi bacterium]|nr:hypothetical protein [Chloroflexota bacterium]
MTRMLKIAIVAALLAAGFLILAGVVWTANAQTNIELRESNARSDFPNGFVFNMTVEAAAGLDEVRLVYEIAPDGVRATAVPACTEGQIASCRFELGANARTLLIPGAEVTYFWRITSGGVTTDTDPQLVVYEDTRFDWQTVTEGNLTVWYYSGDEDEARAVLAAGLDTLDRIGALLRTTVDFPVKILYYDTARDMQAAIISNNAEGVITRGEVVYSDTAMVSADSAAGDITRHEVTHIVVRQAIDGPFGLPDWLNEGTAVYSQIQPLGGQQSALDLAIQNNQVLSVRSLSSASSGAIASRVSLFYGQSFALVDFLIETYGEQKFADLFAAFKEGDTTAGALEQVYGFDQDGLENEWRASVGLPPRSVPTQPADAEDVAPTTAPGPDLDRNADGDGVSGILIAVIVALTAVVAGGIVLAGLLVVRRAG